MSLYREEAQGVLFPSEASQVFMLRTNTHPHINTYIHTIEEGACPVEIRVCLGKGVRDAFFDWFKKGVA